MADVVPLPDGTRVLLRPIDPDDRDVLAAAFERLSPESRYRRFFSPLPRLSDRQLDFLTRVDHVDHEALLAVDEDSGALVGVARYVRTGPGEAEPAMVVADDWQGRGVATVLLRRLVERALDAGIEVFKAPVLAGNADAVHVLTQLGETEIERRGSEVELTIALQEAPPRAEGMTGLLRAVASGTVDPLVTFWHRLLPRGGHKPPVDEPRANVVICAVEPELGPDPPAAALAQQIALASGAAVVLAAARSPIGVHADEQARRLRRLHARMRAHGIDAREALRTGDLAAVVLDLAIEERARLIVVDDPGSTDPAGRLVGSVWDHVSHHAPCSVLVAR
jgi:GNAT superfamily N-acetyltransferase